MALLGEVTVAPVTSTIRDIPSEVILTESDGMPRTCAVNLDHIQTVAKGKGGAVLEAVFSVLELGTNSIGRSRSLYHAAPRLWPCGTCRLAATSANTGFSEDC